jgi:hypothetical protein
MEFLILLALIGIVRIESQMQRITEVVVNLEDKDSEK